MPETLANLLNPKTTRHPRRTIVISVVVVVVLVGAAMGSLAAYKSYYTGKVYPGVTVGGTSLAGFTETQVEQFAENLNNRFATAGVPIIFVDKLGEERTVHFKIIAADDAPESIKLNSRGLAALALSMGRSSNGVGNLLAPLQLRLWSERLTIPVVSDEARFLQMLKAELFAYEDMAHDASLSYNASLREPRIIKEETGQTFDYQTLMADIVRTMATIATQPVAAKLTLRVPQLTESEIATILPKLETVLDHGVITLHYTDPESKVHTEWALTPQKITAALTVARDENGGVVFSLNREKVEQFVVDEISAAIATPAQEAKFAITAEGKVSEFQGSRAGIAVDAKETAELIIDAFNTRNYSPDTIIKTVPVSVEIVEPTVKTDSVNSLGITEIIGTGISTFKNSPANRIKNIAHAVDRLNGILIKPGEDFSANASAGPYTLENGYLPEAVIKGNKIIPEVGGGMCQIGTTLFRMAMNSGMPILERSNHSLVVSYYADPVNGNPGTDATLYEPILDFKFKNDTGNYLLLQTSMDRTKGELRFTLWGRPDGRSGSYTHPVVEKWIPAGEEKTIYVDVATIKTGDIKVGLGETKCQNAFRGAVASFTYTRFTTSGVKLDQVFDSYYRPLPRICMVGVSSEQLCDGTLCEQSVTTTPAF